MNPFGVTGGGLEPGSPRSIARRMALEGAIQLARNTGSIGSPALGDRAEDDLCPLERRRDTGLSRLVPRSIVAGFALLLAAVPVNGQLASANPAALGLGDNYTAAARGLDAVAWNPAALGMFDVSGPTVVALSVRAASGLGPVGLRTIGDWSGALVPDGVKQDWLARITTDGGQVGSGDADVTWAALRAGRFAVHVSSTARVLADVSPGVAELILFGNAGQNGQVRALDLSGSNLTGWAWSTVGASMAVPVATEAGRLSLGVTGKYVIGHGMAWGEQSAGATTVDPVSVDLEFPLVHTDLGNGFGPNGGNGFGMDVGAALETGTWTVAAVVQNVVNSFAWDLSALQYRPLSVTLGLNEARTQTDDMPLGSAPAGTIDRVSRLGFDPVYAGGIAWQYSWDLKFTADARFTGEDGMRTGPARHLGAGMEYYVSEWFPIRLGGAAISMGEQADGWQAAAGFGLELGGWSLSASAMRRSAGRFGDATIVALSLFGIGG